MLANTRLPSKSVLGRVKQQNKSEQYPTMDKKTNDLERCGACKKHNLLFRGECPRCQQEKPKQTMSYTNPQKAKCPSCGLDVFLDDWNYEKECCRFCVTKPEKEVLP